MHKSFDTFLFAVIVVGFFAADASIAQPPANTPTANANMVTEFKGALKSFQRGVMLVSRDDGTEVMVQPPEDLTRFQFIATAKPAFLQRGMLVRFQGTFNQAGVSLSPVTKVELFQPISGKVAGHARQQYIPGVYPEQHEQNQPLPAVATCDIVGAVTGLDPSGLLLVQAGKQPVRVQLSPDVTFELRLNNLSLAQEGDPVNVAGFYQPPDDTKVKADRVTITTDRVYGEPTDEPPKRTARRRPPRTQTNADGKDAAEKKDGDQEAEGARENGADGVEREGAELDDAEAAPPAGDGE